MSVSFASRIRPKLRTTGLAGLVLFGFSVVGCSSEAPPAAVLAPADLTAIQVDEEDALTFFAPTDLSEIEITPESLGEDEPSTSDDAVAVAAPPTREKAAAAWLAGMEKRAEAQAPALARASAPAADMMGALGAGIELKGSDYDPGFAPMRKSFASRKASQTGPAGVASIVDDGARAGGAASRLKKPTRTPVAVGPKSLEPADIKRIVKRQQARVRACYERALKSERRLEGKLTMAWSVKPDGSVDDVAVADDSLGSDKVARCVVGAVARFRFPRSPETVQVEYPMVFSPY